MAGVIRNGGKNHKGMSITKAIHAFDLRAVELTFPSPGLYLDGLCYLSLIIFSTTFWWIKRRCAIAHSCEQMLSRSLNVLPFRLYCHPAYPALMELLKSRYEQNLGGPTFVRACVPIRWEHDDKNQSNACRSCHSMHNNLELCGWKKNTLRQERRVQKRTVLVINMHKVPLLSFLTNLNDRYCKALSKKKRNQGLVCTLSCYLLVDKVFFCQLVIFSSQKWMIQST